MKINNSKYKVDSKKNFYKNLRRYVVVEEFRPEIGGKRVRAWKGIKLVQAVQDVQVDSNFNIINNSNKLKIRNQLDKSDTLDTNWFSGKCSYCGNDTQVTLYQGYFICEYCLKEGQRPKCYKCGSTSDLTQTEDFITHKPLWICKRCLREIERSADVNMAHTQENKPSKNEDLSQNKPLFFTLVTLFTLTPSP
jgi:hypothetical protein